MFTGWTANAIRRTAERHAVEIAGEDYKCCTSDVTGKDACAARIVASSSSAFTSITSHQLLLLLLLLL